MELCRELELIGLARPEAEAIARRQIDYDATRHPGTDPPQHVVSVSRGWLVVRDIANLDVGLFDDKQAAIEEANKLAEPSRARVIVHED